MKTTFTFLLLLFIRLSSFGQVYLDVDTIKGLGMTPDDKGVRLVNIPVIWDSTEKIKVMILDPDNGSIKPVLYMDEFKIEKASGLRPPYINCVITLTAASEKYETYRIYKQGSFTSYFKIVVAPKSKTVDTAKKTSEDKTKAGKVSSKKVSLDNQITTFKYNNERNSEHGSTADLELELIRDSDPVKGSKDTVYLAFQNFNLPNESNDSFMIFSPISAIIIDSSQWKNKKSKYIVKINNPPLDSLPQNDAYGKIILEGGNNSSHTIRFSRDTLMHNPGFMFLVAGSFDFDESIKPGFLGHANIWIPYLGTLCKKSSWALNAGIMKIDYSKGGMRSELNKTHYVYQNILTDPLKSEIGDRYIKQYNKISYESSNTSWSFYAQPMARLVYSKYINLYVNLHSELFVNKWNINAKISNLSLDSSGIIGPEKIEFEYENRFAGGSTAYDSSGVNTTLNVFLGIGLTADIHPWPGANVFLQSSLGNVLTDNQKLDIDPVTGRPVFVSEKNHFYLTRCYLEQRMSSNVDAVLGYDCRGYFGSGGSIYYACYLGVNISLNGLFAK